MSEATGFVGTTIAGKYRLKRLIGVGGMGSVYEGQHVDLAKKVAVKIIDSGNDLSPELAMRFKREARAASAVESENIVQVFDVGRDPQVGLYMVMELLHGEDLEMRLRKQPGRRLDPLVVAQIGHQSARALVKAHAARVIHRDLKPANVFLTEREDGTLRVKILDFGISKLLGSSASIASADGMMELTAAGVALGTPQYMSPEQAQGLTTVDHRSDVWGLGVVLYEALAGVPAYPELGTYQETIMKILTERVPPLAKIAPWVPAELARVVHDAIEHDVEKRIRDCSVFAERLAAAVPEAVLGSTGGWNPNGRTASGAKAIAVPLEPPRAFTPSRPITLGEDTQVVVRPSDPASNFEDELPSTTMLAEGVPSTRRDQPKVVVRGAAGDEAPASTGDPTMFQSPAWVAPPNDGPTTMKTLALGKAGGSTASAKPMHAMLAAALTAILIIGVGVAVLALTRRDGSGNVAAAAATGHAPTPATDEAPPVTPSVVAAQQAMQEPAPPATGTAETREAPPSEMATAAAPSPSDAAARVDASR
jgi:serine/threonine protein kinase